MKRDPIRILKEQLLWVRAFETAEELRLALQRVDRTVHEHWLIERHGFRSPARRRHFRCDPSCLTEFITHKTVSGKPLITTAFSQFREERK